MTLMRAQSAGKTLKKPNEMIITPETVLQNIWGRSMKMVLALRRRVNKTTETASDAVMMYGLRCVSPCAVLPMTTGSIGNIHGARTVMTPARNEIMNSNILT